MDGHISVERLRHLFSYGATQSEVNDGLAHIIVCPACWDIAAEAIASLKATKELVPAKRGRPPVHPFQDAREALIVLMDIEEQRSLGLMRAKGWWSELKDLQPRDQAEKVKSVAAIQKREVFETIIRQAMLVSRRDPFEGEHLAQSAHQLVEHLPSAEFPPQIKNGFRLSALTAIANSRRLAGNWAGALSAVRDARVHFLSGEGSPEDRARLLAIHAALSCDTGLFEDAFHLFGQAASIYEEIGNLVGLTTVTIQEADALLMTNLPGEALKKATTVLRSVPSVRLEMLARSIITESMIVLGRLSGAVRSYEATRPLYEELGDELTHLKADFLEALILDAQGCARESEKLLRGVIAGVTELEIYRLSFLWRVALLESLLKREALGKAAQVCEETLQLLEKTDAIHAQMSQVWRALLAAVKGQVLEKYHLAELRNYLVRHWTSPAPSLPLFFKAR